MVVALGVQERKFSYYNGLSPLNVAWAAKNARLRMEKNKVRITWLNPTSPLFSFVKIVKRTRGYSEGLSDPKNIVVYEGTAETYLDESDMVPLETYYYTVYGINGSLVGEEQQSRWLWTNLQNMDAIVGNFKFMTIYNNPIENQISATIEITATTMHLIVVGGFNAHDTVLTFADADKDTLGELVTEIEALNKGWVISRIGEASLPSTNLFIIPQTSVMGEGALITLNGSYPSYAPVNPDWTKLTNQATVVTIGPPTPSISWAWDYDSQAGIVVGRDYDYTRLIYGES
jgi:hypothetical protein